TFVVKNDGSVLGWGANNVGQLGKGTFELPLAIDGLIDFDVVAIGPAGSHALAHKLDGSVWAWGLNANVQLCDGTTITRSSPAQVTNLGAGSGVSALAAGTSYSLALKSDGTVLAWGANSNGQLGDGTTAAKATPVQVTNLGANSGIIAIAAG